MTVPPPDPDELVAYRQGRLDLARFQAVDAWLATRDAEEQVRLLAGDEPETLPIAERRGEDFSSASGRARFRLGTLLGRGGMGEVRLAHDQLLDRDVAIKLCRPRAPDEDVAVYALRLRAFRREAAITAQLEHPAVVPIHDAGIGPLGEPAYVMKRLEGQPLVASRTADLADTVETVLRVAEAIAHAHQRGIVHRDLKPGNVVVGPLGAVSVLDWGLAARTGEHGERAGTPGWMAPEQADGAAADPRMDVYALGALLLGLLTGAPPELSALGHPRVPRGLAALIRACLSVDPRARPADGAAVAGELRRWLSAGVTAAERPGVLRRGMMLARRSPRASVAALVALLLIGSGVAAAVASQRLQARERLRELATTPLDDLAAVRAALRVTADLPGSQLLRARFQAAIEAAEARALLEGQRQDLRRLSARWRERGPWSEEADDLRAALASAGLQFTDSVADARTVRDSPLRDELLAVLVQLQRVLLLDGHGDPAIPAIISGASEAPAWRGLADLLARTQVEAHDLVFCECSGSEAALADPLTADLLLATYRPEPRLVRLASERLRVDPGAFWPRVVSARAAYDAHQDEAARRHALVALGREARSLWPHLLLAYLALRAGDDAALRNEAEAGLMVNPEHLELRLLRAVALARAGDRSPAEALVADPMIAAHLQYHRQHPLGHPMEDAVTALLTAGVSLPEVPADLGPLVPGRHHH